MSNSSQIGSARAWRIGLRGTPFNAVVPLPYCTSEDCGQLVKTYAVPNVNKDAASRYSPAEVVKVERTVICGVPEISRICTSHVETIL